MISLWPEIQIFRQSYPNVYFQPRLLFWTPGLYTQGLFDISTWMSNRHLEINISPKKLLICPPSIVISTDGRFILTVSQTKLGNHFWFTSFSYVPSPIQQEILLALPWKDVQNPSPYTTSTAITLVWHHHLCIDHCSSILTALPFSPEVSSWWSNHHECFKYKSDVVTLNPAMAAYSHPHSILQALYNLSSPSSLYLSSLIFSDSPHHPFSISYHGPLLFLQNTRCGLLLSLCINCYLCLEHSSHR